MNTDAREEIRARIDIADIVGRTVRLKPAGRSLKGLCPFHKEKTPSFHVTPDRGMYHCFGCGKHGDIFSFIMETEGLSFPETLKRLADECGVTLDTWRPDGEAETRGLPRALLLKMHEEAADFFHESLYKSDIAKNYLKSRGIVKELVDDFALGYAPEGWSALYDHMTKLGRTGEELAEAGLCIASQKKEGFYDRFRERVIFPIRDSGGRIIAFAGRAMRKDEPAKYLNSPETALYHKTRTLYGLFHARQGISAAGHVFVVEGYMDWLAMWRAGVRNAVASCGTALTEEHGRILSRFTQKVTFLFDGDRAGIAAAEKAIATLAPQQLELAVCILPGDEDPDSFIGKYGEKTFKEELGKSTQSALAFLLRQAILANDIDTPNGQAAAFRFVEPFLRAAEDSILRAAQIKEAAAVLRIDEKLAVERLAGAAPLPPSGRTGSSRPEPRPIRQVPPQQPYPDAPPPPEEYAPYDEEYKAPPHVVSSRKPVDESARIIRYLNTEEGSFLHLLTRYPALVPLAKSLLPTDHLTGSFSAELYSYIVSTVEADPTGATLPANAGDPTREKILSAMLVSDITIDSPEDECRHKCRKLTRNRLIGRRTEIASMLRTEPDPEKRMLLLKEQNDVAKKINRL